jgi:diaminopimelate epimerase
MTINFYKYQGTGNDFIMIDDRSNVCEFSNELISDLCDRRMGIGADGLILIKNHVDLDFEMVYYNADGSQSLCGNGSRCAVNFARSLNIVTNKASFLTIDGIYRAIIENEVVSLAMKPIDNIEEKKDAFFINNGSPHHIIFTKNNAATNVYSEGKKIRESEEYQPGGTNVNFVELFPENTIDVRTFERGVEDETLSCGTGVAASALAASYKGVKSPAQIKTKGGDLKVAFSKTKMGFENIILSGPAVLVYQGKWSI